MKDVIKIKQKELRMVVGGDAHYLPGQRVSTGHLAFVEYVTHWGTNVVVLNGDMFDFSQISKYPPTSWKKKPALAEEIA